MAVVNLAVGVTWLLTSGDGAGADAERSLSRAAAFMNEATSFRATITTRSESSPLAAGEAGSEELFVTNTELTVGGDDRWHVVSDSGDWYDEMLRIGPTVWNRWSESEAELADAEWDELPWPTSPSSSRSRISPRCTSPSRIWTRASG